MKCEILASVMNQKRVNETVDRLKIADDDKCLIINQVTEKLESKDIREGNHRFFSYKEKGLSKSRNHALDNAEGDVCLIADDDMFYVKNYATTIKQAYKKHPDADIIAFIVDREGKEYTPKIKEEGELNSIMTMKLSSVQLSFKRESIERKGLRFDEEFGAGAKYPWGEENIFLFDCIRAGLKVYYVPVKIATLLDMDKTSWDRGNTPKHFEQQGAIYYRMSPSFWRVLTLQFVLRKRKIYSRDMSGISVYQAMVRGAKKYKREHKNV